MFYWYAKFCSNILITDDTGNAQILESACITSNSNFPISFLMRNRKYKWIQLKSYCRFFLLVKVHDVYFKTVPGFVYIRFTSLPNRKLYHVTKNAGKVLRVAYIQTISPNKKENQASLVGVETRIVKQKCLPPKCKNNVI